MRMIPSPLCSTLSALDSASVPTRNWADPSLATAQSSNTKPSSKHLSTTVMSFSNGRGAEALEAQRTLAGREERITISSVVESTTLNLILSLTMPHASKRTRLLSSTSMHTYLPDVSTTRSCLIRVCVVTPEPDLAAVSDVGVDVDADVDVDERCRFLGRSDPPSRTHDASALEAIL